MQYLPNILVIDDDPLVFEFIQGALENKAKLHYSDSGKNINSFLHRNTIDLIFVDLHLPGVSGHDIIKGVKNYDDSIQIVVISSSDEINDAIRAFRFGINDFLPKPLSEENLNQVFEKCLRQNQTLRTNRVLSDRVGKLETGLIVGESETVKDLLYQIEQLKGSGLDVLILGESGTGKELVAKTLHNQEGKKTRPYVTLNCSVIPRELMESVLFGHEKGSFTGAVKKQLGKFELANYGDIFLDEISTLSFDLQAKLLRVLQEREIEPVGLGQSKKLEFRVIAATNEELTQLVKENGFRMDLYYRLNKIILRIPPLRERKNDIAILVDHFFRKYAKNNPVKTITDRALEVMHDYSWPGNVRELENIVENLIFTTRSEVIDHNHILKCNMDESLGDLVSGSNKSIDEQDIDKDAFYFKMGKDLTLDQMVKNAEKHFIKQIIHDSATKQEVASKLAIDRKTLFRKMKLYNLS